MTIENSYRTCLEFREILRILQKASTHTDNFLWQSLPVGKNIVAIHHFEIDFVSRGLVIYFNGSSAKLDPTLPLYVKLDYRSGVFKISEFQVGQNAISCQLPGEIKALELRASPRHKFDEASDRYVSLRPSLLPAGIELGNEIQVRVSDISTYGLGLIISEQNRSYMKNNRILWVTRLQEMELQYPILAEVVYISSDAEGKILRKKELKVGLKLSGVFPPRIYQSFLNL